MVIINSDLETFIAGSYGGKNFNLPYVEENYNQLKELELNSQKVETIEELKQIYESVQEIVEGFDFKKQVATDVGDLVYVNATGKYHIAIGNGYSDVHIPDKITNLILDNYERDIDSSPIINMCLRFILNPKPTQERFNMLANYVTQTYLDKNEKEILMNERGLSEDQAEKFATYMDLQITKEGYLKTSKVVNEITKKWSLKLDANGKPIKEDGKFIKELVDRYEVQATIDEETGEITEAVNYPEFLEERKFEPAIYTSGDEFFSGDVLGYKYEIGKLASLPSWDHVSMVDGTAHQKGLHTGGLSYVEGYIHRSKNRLLLDVFVCPSQIAKFVAEGLGEMTCKEFFIYGASSMEGTTRGLYHTDCYSKIQSSDLKERIESKALELEEEMKEKQSEIYDMSAIAKALAL